MKRLDRVVQVQLGVRAEAVRNVPATLEVFTTHFPRFPVLPGVLLLEDMIAVTRLALGETDRGWRLAQVQGLQYRNYVQAGDQLRIEVMVLDTDGQQATCKGTVRVDDRVVCVARMLRLDRGTGEEDQ